MLQKSMTTPMMKGKAMKIGTVLKRTAAALICAAVAVGYSAASVSAEQKFEKAEDAVSNINAGWNLGNALDSCGEWIGLYTNGKPENYETAWGNPVTTKKLITAVKNAGFNAVRVPVTWAEHIDEKGNIDEEWLNRVQEVVDYVVSQDLYCVLNIHHDAGSDGWLEASADCYKNSSEKFAGLWKNIAERFRDYDEKLIFEGFNEILDSTNSWTDAKTSDAYAAVNNFNQLFVDTVRETGGNNKNRNLMVQVYSGSCSVRTLNAFELPDDTVKNHLIIHAHNYDPQGFTASDATWTTMTDTWGSDAEKKYFDNLFERLEKFTEKQGAPMVIGEFGANYKGNEKSRQLYAQCFVSTAAKHGIKCFWWDTGDMALFDRSTAKVKYPDIVKVLTTSAKAEESRSDKTDNSADERLEAPVLTAKVNGSGKIKLSWTEVDGADRYRVYLYNAKTKKYTRIATLNGTSYTVKNAAKNTAYKYKVCAVKKTDSCYKNGFYSKAVRVKLSK